MGTFKTIPALTAKDLDVLKSVKVVTGHVVIDGGNNNQSGFFSCVIEQFLFV